MDKQALSDKGEEASEENAKPEKNATDKLQEENTKLRLELEMLKLDMEALQRK